VPKEALLKEILLRVLAIIHGGDNSLCPRLPGQTPFAGYEAPLIENDLLPARTYSAHYSNWRPFSWFVVCAPHMLDSFPLQDGRPGP